MSGSFRGGDELSGTLGKTDARVDSNTGQTISLIVAQDAGDLGPHRAKRQSSAEGKPKKRRQGTLHNWFGTVAFSRLGEKLNRSMDRPGSQTLPSHLLRQSLQTLSHSPDTNKA